jgi:MFS family permease
MAWQMYELTDSPLQLGLIGLARALPRMALVLVGGLLADAVDRRRLLLVTQAGQMSVSVGLVIATVAGVVTPIHLYVATGLLALFGALGMPARQAIVPNLVPRTELAGALALSSTQHNVGQILGPSLGGVLLAVSSPAWCYAVDAASWLATIVALQLIGRQLSEVGRRGQVSFSSLGDGLRFVRGQPVVLSLMALDFAATFFGGPRALLPVYARDILHVGAGGLGVLYAAIAVGSLLAAVGLSMVGQPDRAGRWVLLGIGAYALCVIGFAFSPVFWLSVLLLAGMGAGDAVSSVLRGTVNQLVTPDELRGRVSSVNSIFSNGGPPLGQFESGLVADRWGAEVSVVSGGIATLLIVLAVAAVPAVRHFRLPSAPAWAPRQ